MYNNVRHKIQDFTLQYKVPVYKNIEKLLEEQGGETHDLHFMLAMLGINSDRKIDLNYKDDSNEPRTFSLRTMYPRNENDFDVYYGLLTILDNLDKEPEEVVGKLAFEKTGLNNTTFLKLTNVKTFYEYMLGGISVFEENFFVYGHNAVDVVDSIHDFLAEDIDGLSEQIEMMKREELDEDE